MRSFFTEWEAKTPSMRTPTDVRFLTGPSAARECNESKWGCSERCNGDKIIAGNLEVERIIISNYKMNTHNEENLQSTDKKSYKIKIIYKVKQFDNLFIIPCGLSTQIKIDTWKYQYKFGTTYLTIRCASLSFPVFYPSTHYLYFHDNIYLCTIVLYWCTILYFTNIWLLKFIFL